MCIWYHGSRIQAFLCPVFFLCGGMGLGTQLRWSFPFVCLSLDWWAEYYLSGNHSSVSSLFLLCCNKGRAGADYCTTSLALITHRENHTSMSVSLSNNSKWLHLRFFKSINLKKQLKRENTNIGFSFIYLLLHYIHKNYLGSASWRIKLQTFNIEEDWKSDLYHFNYRLLNLKKKFRIKIAF